MDWDVLSSLATIAAAIVAIITVYHIRTSWQKERESRRPYIAIEEPGIKPLPQSPPFRMQITMRNIGKHPASQFEGAISIFDKTMSGKFTFNTSFTLGNDVPPDSPTPWYTDNVLLPQNVPIQYICLFLKYRDPILEKRYSQIFYMRWDGVSNGITHPDFVYVSSDESDKILDYLKESKANLLRDYNENL